MQKRQLIFFSRPGSVLYVQNWQSIFKTSPVPESSIIIIISLESNRLNTYLFNSTMTLNLALYLSTYDVSQISAFFQRLINYHDFNDIKRTIRESAYYCHRLNFSNFYKTFRKVIHFKVNNAKNAIFGNIIRKAFWYYCFSLLKF